MNFIRSKAGLLLILIISIVWCLIEAGDKGDFFIFLSAASDLNDHANIFEKTYVDGYHYYYSVLFAVFLKLFVHLSFYWVRFGWLLLNMFLFLHLLWLMMNSDIVKRLKEKQQFYLFLFTVIFSLRFLRDNIHTSQITILILWTSVYGLYNIIRGKTISGSLILCIGINIKLLPVVFIPYLFYRGYFKAAFLTIVFYISFLFLPSIFIGHEYNISLLKTWLKLINPTNQSHVLDVSERSFHGLSTLLSTLLVQNVPDQFALPLKRNIADINHSHLSTILLVVRLLLVALTLYFLRWTWFKKPSSKWQYCIEISYLLLVIPLIFPHQQHYAFLFAVPAALCIFYYSLFLKKSKRHTTLLVFLSLVYLTFNLKLLLGEFNEYYEHYKILTYGALLLIPLLMLVYSRAGRNHLFLRRST